jgi:hypothetical protein
VEERFGVRLAPEPAFWPAGALTRSAGLPRVARGLPSSGQAKISLAGSK